MPSELWTSKSKMSDLKEVQIRASHQYISVATEVLADHMAVGLGSTHYEHNTRVVQLEAFRDLAEIAIELTIMEEAEQLGIPMQRPAHLSSVNR